MIEIKRGGLCKYKAESTYIIARIYYSDDNIVKGVVLHTNTPIFPKGIKLLFCITTLTEVNADDLEKVKI